MAKTGSFKIETSAGVIEGELYGNEAPKTVKNFADLANKGFYNGIIFHRVIPDFMVQTGDPTGTGAGGPGYTFEDEIAPDLKHDSAGVVSMANAGPNTNGSQFFITLVPTPWLNGRHAIFGHVVQGQEIAKAIASVERDAQDKPLQAIMIKQVLLQE